MLCCAMAIEGVVFNHVAHQTFLGYAPGVFGRLARLKHMIKNPPPQPPMRNTTVS